MLITGYGLVRTQIELLELHAWSAIVVDESHNAESDLSVDMLNALNPSFVLDLTATPKDNSNIVSLVPAIEYN